MKTKERVSRRSKIILEIRRLFKVSAKYEKIILSGKPGSRQKTEAIKSRNSCARKILKLMDKLIAEN